MWLLYALATFFAWGIADLFYKRGNGIEEKYTHLKTAAAVGLVMGCSAGITLLRGNIGYDARNLLIYLPVSSMYILSMAVGYFGLRYLELSVSSPVQNASGAVTCLLLMLFLHEVPDAPSLAAVFLITVGVVLLGYFEKGGEELPGETGEQKYRRGFKAVSIPVLYCVIDSLGTFFDGWYLDDIATTPLLGVTEDTFEDVANVSYEITFFLAALIILFYLYVLKKEKLSLPAEKSRFAAALFETAGQLSYVYALSGNAVVAAPLIASYCVCSAVLARIVLKEKLNRKQYAAVLAVILGILLIAVDEG